MKTFTRLSVLASDGKTPKSCIVSDKKSIPADYLNNKADKDALTDSERIETSG